MRSEESRVHTFPKYDAKLTREYARNFPKTRFSDLEVIALSLTAEQYHRCTILGDKGYLSASVQLDLFETSEIRLEVPYRLNQKDWKPTFAPFAKARKRVETLFSQMVDQFMLCRNYAKQQVGLFARIISKTSALTILQYINFINNKPLGQIKHALL